MFTKIRKRFSSAHVLAGMALFVALGGSAYALKKNSVGTKAIKNSAVKEAKIADAAVTTAKLGSDAVTGAKVNESTLGKVPSATTADTAASATTATDATNATNATNAANAEEFDGRTISQVRGLAVSDTTSTNVELPDGAFAEVLGASISIPTGGAALVVNASVEVFNDGAAARNATCELRSDGVDISQEMDLQLVNVGISDTMSLTGFATFANATGVGDPENVGVFCDGSIAAGDVEFVDGDLTVERIPTAN